MTQSDEIIDRAHFGDPCVKCGVGHDDVAPGPCPGVTGDFEWKCNCCTTVFRSNVEARSGGQFDAGPTCPRCTAFGQYTYRTTPDDTILQPPAQPGHIPDAGKMVEASHTVTQSHMDREPVAWRYRLSEKDAWSFAGAENGPPVASFFKGEVQPIFASPVLADRISERDGWLTIDNAPMKQGAVAVPNGSRWSFHHAHYDDQQEAWIDIRSDEILEPTHWFPLPGPAFQCRTGCGDKSRDEPMTILLPIAETTAVRWLRAETVSK